MNQLSKKHQGNIELMPIMANQVYDSVITTNKINSNLPISFDIFRTCTLPMDTKISICETDFKYNIFNIDNEILLNGHSILTNSYLENNNICLKKEYVNLMYECCENIILNVVQRLSFDVNINIQIRGDAYIDKCKSVYFEAEGKGSDKINTLIISEIMVPNFLTCNQNNHLNFKNEIIGMANPEFAFLSPIYDDKSNIKFLLGNVFLNYIINLNISSLQNSTIGIFTYK